MKILAIGDFHGKFPEKLKKLIEKEKFELIVSIGDYFPFTLKKVFFKCCYKSKTELWDVVGKKEYKKINEKDLAKGEKVLKQLNKLKTKVITTIGNYDKTNIADTYKDSKSDWEYGNRDFFSPIINKYKNIKRFDYKFIKYKNLIFIGGYGNSFPGRVKSKNYKKYKKKLEKLFNRFKKENKEKKVIFVFHNIPYNCKLDVIRDKTAPEIAFGKHYGSKLIRRIIDKYHPILGIGGHMHENQGKCNIGKTLIINPGAAQDGKAAIILFDEKKKKVDKIKFIL